MQLKILTLNTHSWLEERPYQKLNALVDALVNEQYDVIALQEVNQLMCSDRASMNIVPYFYPSDENSIIKQDNFALLLVNMLSERGLEYYWSWCSVHIGYGKYDEGLAILSRYPIEDVESIPLSYSNAYDDYKTRKALGVRIKAANHSVWFFNLHFSWWEKTPDEHAFQYEWQTLQSQLSQKNKDDLLVLLGDFNNAAHVKNEGYSLITQDYIDAFVHARNRDGEFTVVNEIDGWSGNQQQLRIDYVFFSKPVDVEQYNVVFDGRNSPVVSDHFGVSVIFNDDE